MESDDYNQFPMQHGNSHLKIMSTTFAFENINNSYLHTLEVRTILRTHTIVLLNMFLSCHIFERVLY